MRRGCEDTTRARTDRRSHERANAARILQAISRPPPDHLHTTSTLPPNHVHFQTPSRPPPRPCLGHLHLHLLSVVRVAADLWRENVCLPRPRTSETRRNFSNFHTQSPRFSARSRLAAINAATTATPRQCAASPALEPEAAARPRSASPPSPCSPACRDSSDTPWLTCVSVPTGLLPIHLSHLSHLSHFERVLCSRASCLRKSIFARSPVLSLVAATVRPSVQTRPSPRTASLQRQTHHRRGKENPLTASEH